MDEAVVFDSFIDLKRLSVMMEKRNTASRRCRGSKASSRVPVAITDFQVGGATLMDSRTWRAVTKTLGPDAHCSWKDEI